MFGEPSRNTDVRPIRHIKVEETQHLLFRDHLGGTLPSWASTNIRPGLSLNISVLMTRCHREVFGACLTNGNTWRTVTFPLGRDSVREFAFVAETRQRYHRMKKQILTNSYIGNVSLGTSTEQTVWLRVKHSHKSVGISADLLLHPVVVPTLDMLGYLRTIWHLGKYSSLLDLGQKSLFITICFFKADCFCNKSWFFSPKAGSHQLNHHGSCLVPEDL